jgi:hypothetical protein
MRYVVSKIAIDQKETTYRFYLSEGIRIIAENTANMSMTGGQLLKASLADILGESDTVHEEEQSEPRTADDVISHIKEGLGD